MVTQKEIFKDGEGDRWFQRNNKSSKPIVNGHDKIVEFLKALELSPKKVLEIGCSNGSRLNDINRIFNAECYGIDPSKAAIDSGRKNFPNIFIELGTADKLSFEDSYFDLIIFGFCLYLCDRKDLFKIAYEADRCLKDQGAIIIYDFYPPFPYKNRYTYHNDIYSFKMNYSKMFKWNPYYSEIANEVFSHYGFRHRDEPDEKICITIIQKVEKYAYPLEPF